MNKKNPKLRSKTKEALLPDYPRIKIFYFYFQNFQNMQIVCWSYSKHPKLT